MAKEVEIFETIWWVNPAEKFPIELRHVGRIYPGTQVYYSPQLNQTYQVPTKISWPYCTDYIDALWLARRNSVAAIQVIDQSLRMVLPMEPTDTEEIPVPTPRTEREWFTVSNTHVADRVAYLTKGFYFDRSSGEPKKIAFKDTILYHVIDEGLMDAVNAHCWFACAKNSWDKYIPVGSSLDVQVTHIQMP